MTPARQPRYKYAPDGTPHPCESCDHWQKDKAPDEWICNKAEIRLLTYPEVALIRTLGCASHSTTHTSAPAPEPDVDCHSCKFGEQCRPTSYIPPCYNHGPNSPAEAAKAAREQVLDELVAAINKRKELWRTGENKKPFCIDTLIQSLRAQQEAEQQ